MEEFLQNIYGLITAPVITLKKLKQNNPLAQGFIIVTAISMLTPIFNNMLNNDNFFTGSILALSIFSLAVGIISWIAFAGFMELFAYVFNQNGNFKTMLTLSAFSLIPWILLGPAFLLKQAGPIFEGIGILISFFIFIWALILFFVAVAISYNLTATRCIIFALMPFIASIIHLYWFIYFIQNLIQTVKV